VLHKCANPGCWAQFRYLHQGKLFEIEIQYFDGPAGRVRENLVNRKGQVERCWLCDRCAARMALRLDPQQGVVMVSSPGDSEVVVTTPILQSSLKAAARIARVLVRPLDLDLARVKRRHAVELILQREVA